MQDRRKTNRRRTYLGAQIALDRQSSMDCLVRNISADGAKLVFTNTGTVPQEFNVTVHQKAQTFRARVIWRRADEAGVAFIEPRHAAPISLDLVRRLRQCEAEKAALQRRVEQLSSAE